MKQFILAILVLLVMLSNTENQEYNRCGTGSYMLKMFKKHPQFKKNCQAIENYISQWVKENKNNKALPKTVIIPVVVHVVYRNTSQNISDQQIISQIEALNRDFNRQNPDTTNTPDEFKSLAASIDLQFVLTNTDPNGNPHSGITRTQTSVAYFDMNDAVKHSNTGGKDIWDRNRFLNIWVCYLNNNLLGYTQMPGGPAETDGVVVSYKAFGTVGNLLPSYNMGRTAVHEVGHWFNLKHPWGDDNGTCTGTDYVDDTPNQAGSSSGCYTHPHVSCNNSGDMFMNYMDYSVDRCMNLFTKGQMTRIYATLYTARQSLLELNNIPVEPANEPIHIFPNPVTNSKLSVALPFTLTSNVLVRIIDINGKTHYKKQFDTPGTSIISIDISHLANGVYFVSIQTEESVYSDKFILYNK